MPALTSATVIPRLREYGTSGVPLPIGSTRSGSGGEKRLGVDERFRTYSRVRTIDAASQRSRSFAVCATRRSGKSMNPRQFDVFTRRLAALGHRRALLRGVLAMIAVAARSGLPAGVYAQRSCAGDCAENQVCTENGCETPCANHRDCRNKHDDPCVLNTCEDGFCTTAIIECLPGSQCYRGECFATSCLEDTDCTVFDPCQWGRCGAEGRCEFTELDPCVICVSDDECLSSGPNTVCCGGACRRPCPDGTVMGKGCECQVYGSANLDGIVVHDDASG